MSTSHVSRRRTLALCAVAVAVFFSFVMPVSSATPAPRKDTTGLASTIGEIPSLRAAYNGYSEGFTRGGEDANSGPDFVRAFDEVFVRASAGYTVDLGSFPDYQDGFRRAYASGYADARSGRERINANPPLAPPDPLFVENEASVDRFSLGGALAAGYDTGYHQGLDDIRDGTAYGFRDKASYLSAAAGYSGPAASRDTYLVVFQQSFSRGYSDGFNGRERYVKPDNRRP